MLIHSAEITGSVQFNNTDVSGITNVAGFATTASVNTLVVRTGSYASTSSVNELQSKTGSYTSTSSFGAYSSSINTFTSSAATRLNTIESVTGSFASTSSVNNLQSVTGSYATTGSNQFNGNQSISGSITSNGTITAQTLVVQTVTSSIEFVTGSTKNGSLAENTHEFTGSVSVTGSLIANNVSVGKGGGNITNNIAVGSQAMQSNTTGNYNTAFGASASYTNVVSNYNTSVGFRALFSNTSSFNTAVGSLALADNASGTGNTAVGFQALNFNTTANYNTAVGSNALFKTTTGNGNTAVGRLANYQNTTGYANSSIGNEALYENTTGFGNTALGSLALQKNTVGTNNIAIGSNAGSNISGGFATNISSTSSIFIGNNTAASASGQTNQIVIGHNVVGLGSNTTILGTSSTVTTALYGNLGIGTTSPNFNSYGTALTLLSSLNYGGIEVYGSGSTKGGQIDFGSGNIRYASISGEYESSDNGFLLVRTRRAGTMTDAVRITSTGNVGIGTTSPTFKLEVSSSGDGISVISSGSSQTLRISSTTNNNTLFRINNFNGNFYDIQNQPSDNSLVIDYNDAERMRIDTNGNILIKTTNAAGAINSDSNRANLVLGASTSSKISFNDGSSTSTGYIYNSPTETAIGYPSAGIFAIQKMGTGNIVTVTSGGNVGIGLTNPQSQFHINGDFTLTESGFDTVRKHIISHSHSDGNSANNNIRFLISNGSGNTAERMRIDGNGHVTIPSQPSFLAASNQAEQTYSSGQVMVFNLTRHNIGSHYNTNNSRFTAPITGRYLFSVNIFTYTSYDSAIVLTINGSQYTPGDVVPYIFRNNFGGNITVSFTLVLELSANDYVEVRTRSGSTSQVYMSHSHFSGHLLG
jgi:hypothetical protein